MLNIKNRIFELLDGISNPLLVLNKDNEVIFANKYFKKSFIARHYLEFESIRQFNSEWLRIYVNNELIIIHRDTTQKLFSIKIGCFIDGEESSADFLHVFNFNVRLNNNLSEPFILNDDSNDETSTIKFENNINHDIDHELEKEISKSKIIIENDTLVFNLRIFAYIKDFLTKYLRENQINERLHLIEKQIQVYSIQLNTHFKMQNINMSEGECMILLYSIFDLSSKEIAALLNKSSRTIQNTKYQIRKKLGLSREQHLNEFINIEIKND